MNKAFLEYYRCPQQYAQFALSGKLGERPGYFQLDPDLVCFGRANKECFDHRNGDGLPNLSSEISVDGPVCSLPVDPTDVLDSMRFELYARQAHDGDRNTEFHPIVRKAYYKLRPFLPVSVRKHLQRRALRRRRQFFPRWPVDCTVDSLCGQLLGLVLRANKAERVPLIWFWPEGYSSCMIMTHDVETRAGLDFCRQLMAIDDSFDIKGSFQLIPEGRYSIPDSLVQEMHKRGFEINIHDLNHDGRLFSHYDTFRQRVVRINRYARQYKAKGFRSGALYHNAGWYDALEFAYDMSVPNTGHMDPQWGGCCTVMPFFIGNVVELPLTATQDYSLFHIFEDYSLTLWQDQVRLISDHNGLISFIIHPDYLLESRAQNTYKALLEYLSQLRRREKIWFALPGDVAEWWRQRSEMELVQEGDSWRVSGPGSERARVAYARIADGRLSYHVELEPAAC